MKKKAFITGISGQDGSYLAELLVENDYDVYGIIRRHSVAKNQETRIDHLVSKTLIKTDYGDLLDNSSLCRLLALIKPDEIYNLGAQSHVRVSFDIPQFTLQTNMIGTLNLLEAYRSICPKSRFYQASSSEMFGNEIDADGFQRETTAMKPVSPYGCSKLAAYCIVRNYRNSYNLFASNGILFNHESPRRGENFVTAKIARGAAAIHRDFCEAAFSHVNLDYKDYVSQNPKFMRPEELKTLKGDSTKARKTLGWEPEYNFDSLVKDMVDYWIKELD